LSVPLALIVALQVGAQSDTPSISHELKQAYATVKKNLLAAAEKLPKEDYAFKPTPQVRSVAEILGHVVTAQEHTCSALTGTNAKSAAPAADKEALVAALKESFATCDKAYDSLTDANALESVKLPRGTRTRAGALAGNITHDTEQYAALSVYMRLKDIVPPSSER
jgi:uncharacterized damage-inducible protein DinB